MSYQLANHGFLIECRTTIQGETYNLTNCVDSVIVKKRFADDVFPMYAINLTTTQQIRDLIRDNEPSFYLKISYYNADNTQTPSELDATTMAEQGITFDGEIRVYYQPYTTTSAKKEEEGESQATVSESMPTIPYQVVGIPESVISLNEACVNDVFQDCTLADVIVYKLSEASTTFPMYIQDPDNKERFTSIFITADTLIPAITNLHDHYHGIYNHNANIFFDENGIYLFDRFTDPEKIPNSNIITCEVVGSEPTESSAFMSKMQVDENNNMKIIYKNMPAIANSSKIAQHNLGSHTVYYFYDDNFNIAKKTKDTETYEKIRYIWTPLNESISYETGKSGIMTVINFASVNPALMRPTTVLKMSAVDYPQMNGDYSMDNVIYVFETQDKQHFTCNITAGFYKK